MPQAAVILIAAFAFAGVAFVSEQAIPAAHCPATVDVIRYFPAPEPQPIYPAPKLLRVDDIGPPKIEPVKEREPEVVAEEKDEPEPHHRRHRRYHRRRHR